MPKQKWRGGALIAPVPAVMVSCGNMEKSNIITVAWTGIINTNPPKTYISVRPQRHSYQIIKESGEFTINLTTEDLVKATDFCGMYTGKKVDKYVKIYSSAGKLVCDDGVDSDKNYTRTYKLTGKPGDIFTVKISDDMSAVWDVACSEAYSVSVDLPDEGVGIGNAFVISAFYFVVPAGRENFTVWSHGLTGNNILELRDRNGRSVKLAELNGKRMEIKHANPDPSKPSVWQLILRNRGTSTIGLENTTGEIFTELPF
jgi:hypothetical protein